jgi:hypothetical protein
MNEIVDAVAARIDARRERRPGDGALWRDRRAEALIVTLGRELREARQLTRRHEAIEQLGIDAVEAEDQHPMAGVILRRAPAADCERERDCREE